MRRSSPLRIVVTDVVSVAGLVAAVCSMGLIPTTAHADERAPAPNRYALDLSGVRVGFVRASAADGDKTLVLGAQDIAPPLVALVDGFAQGKSVTRDVRLTSGAIVRRANDAKLSSVKLPALGFGGGADIELAFVAPKITTQPLLSAKEAPPPPAAARITGFRASISGMQAIEAPKIGAITVTQRPESGTPTTGEITIEVAAGGAPPFVAWHKAGGSGPGGAGGSKAPPRTLHVEYVGAEGATILKLQLDRCAPTSVTPLGASGTTRIALTCSAVRPG